MTTPSVVFVAGSPSPSSRSSFVAEAIAARVLGEGLAVRRLSLRDFDAGDVLLGRTGAPAVAAFVDAARSAAAIVLSTPVYKATYAGGLKALVDLVPPEALVGKAALGIATARLAEHGAGAARAYSELFGFFRARALDSVVVLDGELEGAAASIALSPDAERRVDAAASSLIASLRRG